MADSIDEEILEDLLPDSSQPPKKAATTASYGGSKREDSSAARIQARYRGRAERKKFKQRDDYKKLQEDKKKAQEQKYRRMSDGLSAVDNTKKSTRASGDFGLGAELKETTKNKYSREEEDRHASRIQAHVRGRAARKSYKSKSAAPSAPPRRSSGREESRGGGNTEGLSDYLLERQNPSRVANRPINKPPGPSAQAQDKGKERAGGGRRGRNEDMYATRIQSQFRGHMARKEYDKKRRGGGSSSRAMVPAKTEYGRSRSPTDTPTAGGWPGAAPALSMWENFAFRQKERVIPLPNGPQRRLSSTGGYRLRIRDVSGLLLPAGKGYMAERVAAGAAEYRIGVSLFDEHTGQFYGNTCTSVPTTAVPSASAPAPAAGAPSAVDVDLHFDVYFHSDVSDPRCVAVAEVVLVEREAGAVVQEFALGWAALPLVTDAPATPPPAPSPHREGEEGAEEPPPPPARVRQSYVMAGSPRYLMFQGLPSAPPPRPLGASVLSYELEAYPALLRCAALLPPNCLVTYADVVPGLRRFGRDGQLTLGTKNITSSLASPMLAPLRAVVLRGLCVALPPGFHRILSRHEVDPRAGAEGGATRISEYELRVGVHNGRAYTSPPTLANSIELVALPSGGTILQMDEDVFVEELLDDSLVAVVVELVYTGPRRCEPAREEHVPDDDGAGGIVVGWAPVMPFDRDAPPMGEPPTCVREGRYDLTLRSGPGRWLRNAPLLDWRSHLSRGHQTLPAPPKCFFTLESVEPYGRGEDPAAAYVAAYGGQQQPQSPPGLGDMEPAVSGSAEPSPKDSTPRPASPAKDSPRPARPAARPSPLRPAPPPRRQQAGEEGAPLVGVVAQQQAQQLGGIANLQQQQLNQLSALDAPKGALDLVAQQQQQQLAQLAEAMQSQLNQLASTLEGLQAPSTSLPLSQRPTDADREGAATAIQKHVRGSMVRQSVDDGANNLEALDRLGGDAQNGPGLYSGGTKEGVGAGGGGAHAGVSRATRARLAEAGDVDALPVDVRALLRQRPQGGGGLARGGRADLSLEASDVRVVNDVVLQMVAFRRHDALNAPERLRSIFFTFQFYDFPPTSTQRARLDPAGGDAGSDDGTCVLVRDRRGDSEPDTGLVFKFTVDGADGDENTDPHQLQDRRMHFVRYLATRALSVDVWDGESQLQLGTCSVDLRGLLRQGREFAEAFLECHVVDHGEFNPGEGDRARERRAALASATGGHPVSLARGQLLLRVVNIGKLAAGGMGPQVLPPPGPPGGSARVAQKKRRVRVKAAPESGGVVAADLLGPAAGAGSRALTVVRTESGRATGVRVEPGKGGGSAVRHELTRAEERKMARRRRLAELESGDRAPATFAEEQERDLRGHMLQDIEHARERRRREIILGQLRQGMSAGRVVRPSYGELIFFEHEFRNPYARDAVFSIEVSDPDLQLVTSTPEWRALREATGAQAGGAEEDALAGNRLFLAGDERVSVPFKFQCFEHRPVPIGGRVRHADEAESPMPELPFPPKKVRVELVCIADGRPAAVLEVEVRPRPLVVDRTLRFHAPEGEFLKRRVHLPDPPPEDGGGGEAGLVARCSDDRATVGASSSAAGAGGGGGTRKDEVWVKVKCGSAPETRRFYVVLFRDRHMARVHETWLVYAHSLKRVDMAAATGQTSRASVVVRGTATSRRVRAFSSHPDELQVSPESSEHRRGQSFMLVAGALHELTLGFRPLVPGRLDVLVHLVDDETGEKVHALLVATDAHAPTVSKTFEVEVAEGSVEHKKISFTNPYASPHSFHLRCTHPWLVHFRPERLDLPPNGTRPMGLTFDGRGASPGVMDVLVFVNDEDDKNEDCFRVRIRVAEA